jgi:hypothetical protein
MQGLYAARRRSRSRQPPTMTEPDPGTYLHDSGDADDVDHYLSIALATGPPLAVSTHLGHPGIGPCRGCRSHLTRSRSCSTSSSARVRETSGGCGSPGGTEGLESLV